MSYVVFALKWRPQDFDQIIGQEAVVTTLKNAIQRNRLAHAYLFSGPRGVGKTSIARILAKALNCKEGPTLHPCGKCASCLEISQSRSLDVIEIDGASNRGIDEIRTIRESVKFAPTQGKFKIYIIDEVHQITPDGFNALLKTLEEPPEFVKFIFATTQPNKVIPTILSRCQCFNFRRISLMETMAQLEKIASAEKINVDKDVLVAIAKSSDGSLRDAESVLDQLVSFAKDRLSLKDVLSVLGLIEQDVLFEMTDKIIRKNPQEALALLNHIIDEGKDIAVFLTQLIEHFRNLMVAKVAQADAQLIDMPKEICDKLLIQSQAFSLEEVFSAFNILLNAQENAKRLDSLRLPLEISLVKLAHDKKETTPNLRHNPQHRPNDPVRPVLIKEKPQEPVDPPAAAMNSIAVSLEEVKCAWLDIIDRLSKTKISAATYLNEGKPTKVERNTLTVAFPKNYSLHKESLERKDNRLIIEKAFTESLKTNLKINFVLSQEAAVVKQEEDSPLLKSALQTFNGRVIKEE